jgi:hypothetical protein
VNPQRRFAGIEYSMPSESVHQTEGRTARGMRLVDEAWQFLRAHPRLLALPALSALATTIAALVLFLPSFVWAEQQGLTPKLSAFVGLAAAALPFTFIATFFNVAFLAMVIAAQEGQRPGIRYGFAVARSRIRAIVAWSLVAAVVGTALRALENIPGAEPLGRVVSGLGGLAWALVSQFAIPVLALHGTGPKQTIERSSQTFRRRWGEQITGDVVIGVTFFVAMIPGLIALCAGFIAVDESSLATGVLLVAIGVVLLAPVIVASDALTQMFNLSLYRYAADGAVTGPFDEYELKAAVQPRKRRWWQRGSST